MVCSPFPDVPPQLPARPVGQWERRACSWLQGAALGAGPEAGPKLPSLSRPPARPRVLGCTQEHMRMATHTASLGHMFLLSLSFPRGKEKGTLSHKSQHNPPGSALDPPRSATHSGGL